MSLKVICKPEASPALEVYVTQESATSVLLYVNGVSIARITSPSINYSGYISIWKSAMEDAFGGVVEVNITNGR